MDFQMLLAASFYLLCLIHSLPFSYAQTDRVPALFIFGDSTVDVGNNNELPTIIKANFPPYGRDYINQTPTGRFSNGKLATDFIAKGLRFPSSQPPYLSGQVGGRNLLLGANFASAGSGYHDTTAQLFQAISLTEQLENYKEYRGRVIEIIREENATSLFSRGIHLVSTGSSDFVQNYYINPLVNIVYNVDQFSDLLIQDYANFVEDLYQLGARKIGVTTLPPIGCLPAAITLFGLGSDECVERLNRNAMEFNQRLNSTSEQLKIRLPGLNLVVVDVYQTLYGLITRPGESGFTETRHGCCGTGLVETSILCNALSLDTCYNATEYVFWDTFHPSEAANEHIANDLIVAGYHLVY
ncbi:hypothetical protein TIFTF001_041725 [Ficus carica]|uniref:GDSL esterase/lipase n=1 Tax=Ficus carica TaxID=3494 RepID=A0AA87ZUL4_FICCA|nr:hypothetical protein TIFTF001_041725 [Ficus carica]